MKHPRRLKVFIKRGRRYRIVFASPNKSRVKDAVNMYAHKKTAIHYDPIERQWLIGVR